MKKFFKCLLYAILVSAITVVPSIIIFIVSGEVETLHQAAVSQLQQEAERLRDEIESVKDIANKARQAQQEKQQKEQNAAVSAITAAYNDELTRTAAELEEANSQVQALRTLFEQQVDFDKMCYVVQGECGSSGYEHKLLIANVILNRVKHSNFSDTIEGVLAARGQFIGYKSFGYKYRYIEYDTVLAVAAALDGEGTDATQGALYFYAPAYVTDQAVINWFESQTFVYEKYGHRFYK